MKGFTFVLCLAFATTAVLGDTREQCEAGNLSPGYYPHSRYCNKFYSCVFDTLYEHTCVSPFVWNNDIQNCDYRDNVECNDLIIPSSRMDVADEIMPEHIPEPVLEDDTPQTAQGCPCAQACQGCQGCQGCPCAQGCMGADEDAPASACGCGCAGAAPGGCAGGCPGGCGCGCGCGCAAAPGQVQQPCPQVPGNVPATCPCGCNITDDIPRPPTPVDIVRRLAQAVQPPRPGCGCGCQNCQGANNMP